MANYTGTKYSLSLEQTQVISQYHLVLTFTPIPFAVTIEIEYRIVGDAGAWTVIVGNATSPRTHVITAGNYDYRIKVYFTNGDPSETLPLTLVIPVITDNYIQTPKINPLIFYADDRATSATYQTPHLDQFPHEERGKAWLQGNHYCQVWQTTDIIPLQFSSTFDPIVIDLLNEYDQVIRSWIGLNKLPNKDFAGLYVFEFALSMAGITTGCYRFKRTLGTGEGQVIEYTACQFISSVPIEDTLLIKYKNSRFIKDVLFETGIEFQLRVHGWIDYDNSKKEKKVEGYRNQKFTSAITSAKSTDVVPIYFGDELGIPVEMTALIEEIFSLDSTMIDGVYFTLPPDKEFEYTDEKGYRMRGMKGEFEPGNTRYSRITKVNADPAKKLMYGITIDQQALADTTGQGNNDTVPLFNVIIQ